MKTEISNMNLVELNISEQAQVNGGNPWIGFFVAYVAIETIMNPTASIESFKRGWNSLR